MTFSIDPSVPFLDCFIWEVKQWPKISPSGTEPFYYTINDVYHYNSLSKQDYESKKQSVFLQIPEPLILNVTYKDHDYIVANLQHIVQNELPVIKQVSEEQWECDLSVVKKTLDRA